jgi:hypothetical protein
MNGKPWKTFKKLHKWPGLIISLFLLYFAITGIIMNHRDLFSGVDIKRNLLPVNYRYRNWNNAALKGNLIINADSILVYGNIGIWITDSGFGRFVSLNAGFPEGSDNRKIFDVHRADDGELYAATLFGLFAYSKEDTGWHKFEIDTDTERFTGIESVGDTLFAINRSYLYKGQSQGTNTVFEKIELRPPVGHTKQVTLFETIWQIHSGEIFGLPGKIYVDLLGAITIFLCFTGIIYFFFPVWIRRLSRRSETPVGLVRISSWSLKWHNKLGAWTFVSLIALFFTGMFLRPPLLIAIARVKTAPLKYSHLDQPNPWYDKLRDIVYDKRRKIFLLSTSEGMYSIHPVTLQTVHLLNQPPVSVMGINTFEQLSDGAFLIGSFSGLFLWDPDHPEIYSLPAGTVYEGETQGRPVGDFAITGVLQDMNGNRYMVDYNNGIIPLLHKRKFPDMPADISESSHMSLWNVCLEIHTGRIFQTILGDFYILIVPLAGLTGIIIVISGYMVWRRKFRKSRK